MSFLFKKYKRIFRRNLQPVLAMLVVRKQTMAPADWQHLLDETLRHVTSNPIEYLGPDLPNSTLLSDILAEIRTEFIKEMTSFKAVRPH